MNIFKRKKFVVTALISAMILALARQPLPAMERRGSTVAVTLTLARGTVQGELLAVKEDALLIYDHSAGRGQRIELQDVFQVKIVKKSKFFGFAVIGMVFGFVLADLQHRNEDRASLLYGAGYLFFPPITGLFGGILGAIAGTDKRFSLAGESIESMQETLERLKHFAREQDAEKPSAPELSECISSTSAARGHGVQRLFRHHLRLLWSLGAPMVTGSNPSDSISGTFHFVGNGLLKDTAAYPFQFNPYSDDRPRAGQFRLEFEWTPHFSPSLEFIASGKVGGYWGAWVSYFSNDYGKRYESYFFFNHNYALASLLLGLNWKTSQPSVASKNVFELGMAVGPARVREEFGPYQFHVNTWLAKIHAAYDYYFIADNMSVGVFIEYRHLAPSFSGIQYVFPEEFHPEGKYRDDERFTRQIEVTIPNRKAQLGGWLYGFRLGLRF